MFAWGRLKASLLAAAAAAHPAAAADHVAAAVRADTAAREWMAAAGDIVDQHAYDRKAMTAAAAKVCFFSGYWVGAAVVSDVVDRRVHDTTAVSTAAAKV